MSASICCSMLACPPCCTCASETGELLQQLLGRGLLISRTVSTRAFSAGIGTQFGRLSSIFVVDSASSSQVPDAPSTHWTSVDDSVVIPLLAAITTFCSKRGPLTCAHKKAGNGSRCASRLQSGSVAETGSTWAESSGHASFSLCAPNSCAKVTDSLLAHVPSTATGRNETPMRGVEIISA